MAHPCTRCPGGRSPLTHADHVRLLRGGIPGPGGTWADLGSGWGAFTMALADLLGPEAEIHSVDRDHGMLARQERDLRSIFPAARVEYRLADFTRPLSLPQLDGVVMANSLHFQRDKERVLRSVLALVKPGGRFLLVEYDTDRGNLWVPHPISFGSWEPLAARTGLAGTRLLERVPSGVLAPIYSAVSEVPPGSDQARA